MFISKFYIITKDLKLSKFKKRQIIELNDNGYKKPKIARKI